MPEQSAGREGWPRRTDLSDGRVEIVRRPQSPAGGWYPALPRMWSPRGPDPIRSPAGELDRELRESPSRTRARRSWRRRAHRSWHRRGRAGSTQRRARAGTTGKKTAVITPTTPPRVPRPRSSPTSSFAATRWQTHPAAEGSAGSCSCAKGWRAGSIAAPRAARRPSPRPPGITWWRDCPSRRCTSASSTCWPASRCHAERP
jgi:hypothetical protein